MIQWHGTRTNVTAHVDGYVLNAYKHRSGEWRWTIRRWCEPIREWKPIDPPITSRADAQQSVENALNEHLTTNRLNQKPKTK